MKFVTDIDPNLKDYYNDESVYRTFLKTVYSVKQILDGAEQNPKNSLHEFKDGTVFGDGLDILFSQKIILDHEVFDKYKFIIADSESSSEVGFLNYNQKVDAPHTLWFVHAEPLTTNIHPDESRKLKEEIEKYFPKKEYTYPPHNFKVIVDRKVEQTDGTTVELIRMAANELGYNIDNLFFMVNQYGDKEKYYAPFCREMFYYAYWMQFSMDTLWEKWSKCLLVQNIDYSEFKSSYFSLKSMLKGEVDKTFLCYNHYLTPHRLFMMSELLDRNLLDNFLYSMRSDQSSYWGNFEEAKDKMAELYDKFVIDSRNRNKLDEIYKYIPTYLDFNENEPVHDFNFAPTKSHHESTYFSLVNETSIDGGPRITEKTLKSAIFHPFLIWGSPGCLGLFKSFGFKTFSNIFDESYDLIKDDSERMECILGEVKRMCDNSKTRSGSSGRDLPKESFRSCVDIIKHNREVFRKFDIIKFIDTSLQKIVN